MATITRTQSFAVDEFLTAAKIHSIIDTSTVAGIVRADLASSLKAVTVGAAEPSTPATGELWFDTSPGGNQGVLNEFDGARFRPIATGFLGHYPGAGTIDAGSLVKLDATALTDARIPVNFTSSEDDEPIGVAIKQMTPSAPTAPIITRGKVFAAKKATGASTAIGDGLGPSTTNGGAKSTTVGSWGVSKGGSVIAIALSAEASGATTVQAYVTGSNMASWFGQKQTMAALLTNDIPGALNTWSGAFGTPVFINFSAAPAGTIGRKVAFRVRNAVDASGTDTDILIAFRMEGSGLSIDGGAPTMSAMMSAGTGSTAQGFRGELVIPGRPGTNNRAEYLVQSDQVAADLTVTVWERAVILGGNVMA